MSFSAELHDAPSSPLSAEGPFGRERVTAAECKGGRALTDLWFSRDFLNDMRVRLNESRFRLFPRIYAEEEGPGRGKRSLCQLDESRYGYVHRH